jgi:hypothetical protein
MQHLRVSPFSLPHLPFCQLEDGTLTLGLYPYCGLIVKLIALKTVVIISCERLKEKAKDDPKLAKEIEDYRNKMEEKLKQAKTQTERLKTLLSNPL